MKTIRNLLILINLFFVACNPNDPTTITDIDGNVYHTVKIGTQTWMVENLKTTKYNDGTAIPVVTDNTAWANLTTGACCNYNNDEAIGTKYGKLYNWYAVETGKLAPSGWHVPTDAEWITLKNYVSGNMGTSGSVAKALATTTDWAAYTDAGTIGNDLTKNNSSGFSALPGGERSFNDGTFSYVGSTGFWWSANEYDTYGALSRYLTFSGSLVYMGSSFGYVPANDKQTGFSVRCIKD